MKIMSYLSDNLGSGGNILEMSKAINRSYGPAYYTNIYSTVKRLEKIGIIRTETEGRNKLIKLDMGNPLSTYYISEAENHRAFGTKIPKEILNGILAIAGKFCISSICALETEKYLKMNRIELLLLINDRSISAELIRLLLRMESDCGTRIDSLILTTEEFAQMMKADELSPIK